MTPQELDDRIEMLFMMKTMFPERKAVTKALIRDCIEAVTPKYGDQKDQADSMYDYGFSDAIGMAKANTKELLG